MNRAPIHITEQGTNRLIANMQVMRLTRRSKPFRGTLGLAQYLRGHEDPREYFLAFAYLVLNTEQWQFQIYTPRAVRYRIIPSSPKMIDRMTKFINTQINAWKNEHNTVLVEALTTGGIILMQQVGGASANKDRTWDAKDMQITTIESPSGKTIARLGHYEIQLSLPIPPKR